MFGGRGDKGKNIGKSDGGKMEEERERTGIWGR